jgi:cation:H+ antiporter
MLQSSPLVIISVFLSSAAVVIVASAILARRADAIADATGIGRVWIGSVLLAVATSMPELGTDISAVRLHQPNLAIGDLFGSTLANMLILAMLDLIPPRGRVFKEATFENTLAACLAILMTAMAVVFEMARPALTIAGIAPESILLVLVYLGGTRAVYRNGIRQVEREPEPSKAKEARKSLKRPLLEFGAGAAAVLLAAPFLAWSAGRIANLSGLGTTFIGTWMVGLVTSLPEMVTSLTAIRIGAFDLAVGDLFGSNSFNMVIFFALDVASPGGSIFSVTDPTHVISGTLGIAMMTLGLAGIVYRAERRYAFVEPGSVLMVIAYVLGILVLYSRVR